MTDHNHNLVPPSHASRTLADLVSGNLADRLVALEALAASLVASGDEVADGATGAELGDAALRAHLAMEVIQAHRLTWLLRERESGSWRPVGITGGSYASHVAATHGIRRSQAMADLRLADTLDQHLPAMRAAVRTGDMGLTQARILAAAATTPARQEALAMVVGPEGNAGTRTEPCSMEEMLLDRAREFRPEHFGVIVRHFARLADLAETERDEALIDARQFFNVSRTMDGFHVAGFLNEENGQLLTEALRAVCGAPTEGDQRSPGHQRADGIGEIARRLLDAGTLGTKQKAFPHLSVLIPYGEFRRIVEPMLDEGCACVGEDHADTNAPRPCHCGKNPATRLDWIRLLEAGPATWADGTGPVPDYIIRKIAATGKICRVLFGPKSEIINLGRTARLFSAAQVKALAARDGHCTWPSCTAPTYMTEAHHTIKWERGGNTDLNIGAPLCRSHHATVDNHNITMTWNRTWRFYYPDGREIVSRPTPWIQRT